MDAHAWVPTHHRAAYTQRTSHHGALTYVLVRSTFLPCHLETMPYMLGSSCIEIDIFGVDNSSL